MTGFRLLTLGLALALLAPGPGSATSDQSRPEADEVRGQVVTRSAGTFRWLPAAPAARVLPASFAVPRQIGRGSWICSPAGFGRGSRCYAN